MHKVNDGRFPDNSPVEVRYPRTQQQEQGDRAAWPYKTGTLPVRHGQALGRLRAVCRAADAGR